MQYYRRATEGLFKEPFAQFEGQLAGRRSTMKQMIAGVVLMVGIGTAVGTGTAGAEIPKTDAERSDIVRHLPWQDGGTFHLDRSKATLSVRKGLEVITGPAVARFVEATQGTAMTESIEAIVVNQETGDFVAFERVTEGRVALNDWDNVNADDLLQGIKQGTEEANKIRQSNGMSPLEVLDWVEKPTLDLTKQTVHWSIRGKSTDGFVVNATTLVFSRFGYEKLTWVGDSDNDSAGFLADMRESFRFNRGAQYADFRPGDKTAAYGVAALVTTLVGAKAAAKIGLIAILVGFAKKLGILIIAAAAGLFGFLKRVLTGKASIDELHSS
jgi:uncharacterized membrane-anchored protein